VSLETIALAERLVADFRDNRVALQLLYDTLRERALWYHNTGRPEDALPVVERTDEVFSELVAGRKEDQATSRVRAEHSTFRLTAGRAPGTGATAEEYEQQTVLFERVARFPNADTRSLSEASTGRLNMSVRHDVLGDDVRAFDQAQLAEKWAAKLVNAFPGMPQYREMQGRTFILLGRSACGLHKPDSVDIARRGVAVWEDLNRTNANRYL